MRILLNLCVVILFVASCNGQNPIAGLDANTENEKQRVIDSFHSVQSSLELKQRPSLATEGHRFPSMEALGGGVSDAVENDLTQNTLVRIENADIDLRSFDTEIKNQGGTSLCSSFAAIAALEHSINRKYHKKIDLSEMDLFYHYGRYDAQMAVDAASSFWLMDEASWPFYLSGPISSSAPGIARITSASGVLTKVSSIIESLRQNYPVIMAITITQPMLLEGGVINRYGWRQNLGHAMVAVGAFFDDRLVNEGGGVLILKNSWGATQGDKGYAYLPLNYCDANAGFQCWAWAVKDVEFMK